MSTAGGVSPAPSLSAAGASETHPPEATTKGVQEPRGEAGGRKGSERYAAAPNRCRPSVSAYGAAVALCRINALLTAAGLTPSARASADMVR